MHFGISIALKIGSYMVRCSAVDPILKTIDYYSRKKEGSAQKAKNRDRRRSTTIGIKAKK